MEKVTEGTQCSLAHRNASSTSQEASLEPKGTTKLQLSLMLCSKVLNPGFAIFSAEKNTCLLQHGQGLGQRLLDSYEK